MIAATIFLMLFVILGGVVMYLSRTIDHGEARFDSTGKVIPNDAPAPGASAPPAERPEQPRDDADKTGREA